MSQKYYYPDLNFVVLKIFSIFVFALFVVNTSSAQQTVVFTPGIIMGSSDAFNINLPDSMSSGDVMVKANFASLKFKEYRIGKDATISFSVKSGLIQKVVFTTSDCNHRFDSVVRPTSGSFPKEINGDKVTWTGNTDSFSFIASKNNTVWISKIEVTYIHLDMTIDENLEKNEITGNMRHATVQLVRKFNVNAWNSLVLPFDMTAEQVKEVFGSNTQLESYKGTTLNDDGSYTLNFEPTTTITANEPVFVYGANKDVNKTIEDVEVIVGPATFTPVDAAFSFTGSYDKMQLQANDWFISSDNKFYQAIGSETMKAMRAVFRPVKAGTAPQSLKSNLIVRPTGVDQVNMDSLSSSNVPIYNMAGQRVSENYRGIVINPTLTSHSHFSSRTS